VPGLSMLNLRVTTYPCSLVLRVQDDLVAFSAVAVEKNDHTLRVLSNQLFQALRVGRLYNSPKGFRGAL